MKIYDLFFTDGRQCRHIVPQPQETEEEELRITQAIFCGRLASMVRIIAPPPEKLPWEQQRKGLWTLGLFILKRLDAEAFQCSWPGGEVIGDKDEISATVRLNWAEGC
jgi:hypothetical protein